MKKFLACFIIMCTVVSMGSISYAAYNSSERSFDSIESALKSSAVSGRIGGGYGDSKRMYGSVNEDDNEVDIYKFSIHLDGQDYLSFKLQVPDGNDYDLYVLDYYGDVIAKSSRGVGENEYITINDPDILEYARKCENCMDDFYVKIECFSGDSSSQYRLDVKTVDGN